MALSWTLVLDFGGDDKGMTLCEAIYSEWCVRVYGCVTVCACECLIKALVSCCIFFFFLSF